MGHRRFLTSLEHLSDQQVRSLTEIDYADHMGIGTILLGMLARSARAHGIRSFRGYVAAENAPMMEILHGLGARVAQEGPLLRVDVPIPDTADELPDMPTGQVFRSVARGELPPFRLRHPGWTD